MRRSAFEGVAGWLSDVVAYATVEMDGGERRNVVRRGVVTHRSQPFRQLFVCSVKRKPFNPPSMCATELCFDDVLCHGNSLFGGAHETAESNLNKQT